MTVALEVFCHADVRIVEFQVKKNRERRCRRVGEGCRRTKISR